MYKTASKANRSLQWITDTRWRLYLTLVLASVLPLMLCLYAADRRASRGTYSERNLCESGCPCGLAQGVGHHNRSSTQRGAALCGRNRRVLTRNRGEVAQRHFGQRNQVRHSSGPERSRSS